MHISLPYEECKELGLMSIKLQEALTEKFLDPVEKGVDEPGGGGDQGKEQEAGGLQGILSKFDEIAQNFAKKFGI
jgi:hypothetical protein